MRAEQYAARISFTKGSPMSQPPTFAPTGAFNKIERIECHMATPMDEVAENIRLALKRDFPEIEDLPEWKRSKHDEPFAIAGGGPSIRYTVESLKHFPVVLAAGSSHDWLRERGVRPRYCLILDPDPAAANYLERPDPLCNYLVASCCHPRVFERLEGYPVTRWHAAGHDVEWYEKAWLDAGWQAKPEKPIIGGGPTCGLRSISIAMLFGYRNLHFFGLDSNIDLNTEDHHAYDFVDPENENLGDIVDFTFDPINGRKYKIAKYMLAQIWAFQDLLMNYGHMFDVTVHGDSLLQEYWRLKRNLVKKLAEQEK